MSTRGTAPERAAERRQSTSNLSASPGEIAFGDREFDEVRKLIRDVTGINMGDSKRQLVYRRLSGRLKTLGLKTFREYIELVKSGDANETEAFSNAVTTNLTSFFRESHHFEYLKSRILPETLARKSASEQRLRLWSAGCSTGEEPYSIAITLKESIADIERWDAKLLATDLDSNVLDVCRNGIYSTERVQKVPERSLKRWFCKGTGNAADSVRVKPELQSLISFKQLNLMGEWLMRGPFDVIFCRNVIIYFDKPTQRVLIDRFADLVADNGYLILGHSETLNNVSDRFGLVGQTIYRKKY